MGRTKKFTKKAYGRYINEELAFQLKDDERLNIKIANLDAKDQGITPEVLDETDILVWWSHARQGALKDDKARLIRDRIVSGDIAFFALHSGFWSKPFVKAMKHRSLCELKEKYSDKDLTINYKPKDFIFLFDFFINFPNTGLTPWVSNVKKYAGNKVSVDFNPPHCGIDGYRVDAKPSYATVLKPNHPVMKGIPREFSFPKTEMYREPFHVPEPDDVLMEERWDRGEWFRSVCYWKVGKGQVFFFRPGHETYAIYNQKEAVDIVQNGIHWLAENMQQAD